ncbi:MAG: AAA family ATPase [Bacteroidales bacterium]|nr:AAA family ATPase [Bacteroidales bacterium]
MDNGYIRIGWNAYGDVEDFNDFEDFTDGGKNVLRAFQNQMKQGDIIASCWSENEVDAIGVVTGDYEYNDSLPEYKRLRKVDWLIKDIKENIVEINDNKKFTLSTVYKSNITVEDALKIVTRHSKQTVNNANRPFVFIIDEINRGEISKIFGELFFSIDPGYRGEKGRVQTQYQNLVEDGDIFKKGFFVPENVYIIGTMNDIDRSVESMDFAFRRRFAFKEIKADKNVGMLDNLAQKEEAIERMKSLNAAIEKVEGLSSAYHIGASYFLKLKDYDGDFDKLWEYHLEGLLREYLRGMTDVDAKIEALHKAYDNEADSDSGQQQ